MGQAVGSDGLRAALLDPTEAGGFTPPAPPVGYLSNGEGKAMDVTELSATELVRAIQLGRGRPSDLMAATLARIAAVNGAVNAIVSLRDAEALMAEARALDGVEPRGPLHGLPLALKDLVAVQNHLG